MIETSSNITSHVLHYNAHLIVLHLLVQQVCVVDMTIMWCTKKHTLLDQLCISLSFSASTERIWPNFLAFLEGSLDQTDSKL